jgi:DNA topoisomerase VI subunit A
MNRFLVHQVKNSSLSQYCRQPLSKTDHKKVQDLRSRPYVKTNPALIRIIDDMVASDQNVELEAFTDNDIAYLADELIPESIAKGLWV